MKKIAFFLILSLVQVNYSIACTCKSLKKLTKKELKHGEVKFVGTVLEKTYIDKYTMVTKFSIDDNLSNKGLPKEYEIWSGRDCEPHFEKGDSWYIYGTLNEGKNWSIICSLSAQLTDRIIPPYPYKKRYRRQAQHQFNRNQTRAKREIKFLKKLKATSSTY